LAIRADKTLLPLDQMLLYATTRDSAKITGTLDWEEFVLTAAEKLPPTAKSISLYLLYLPRTTGAAYFDDIRLEFN
jgi:hypothetical protein